MELTMVAKANSLSPIGLSAVKVLARLAAKKAVQANLRDQGVRVSLVRPAVIAEQATEYLANHPELYVAAHERAQRMTAEGVFGKRAQRAYHNNSAQKENEPKSITSSAQMLGAK
jgi:protein involved in temperature-dependent protein secretion